jgi:hypothetical protein
MAEPAVTFHPLDLAYDTEKAILAHELSKLPADYEDPPQHRVQLYNMHKKLVALSQLVYTTGLQSGHMKLNYGCHEFQVLLRDCIESLMPDILEIAYANKSSDVRIDANKSSDVGIDASYFTTDGIINNAYSRVVIQGATLVSYSDICQLTRYIYTQLTRGFPPYIHISMQNAMFGYPELYAQTLRESCAKFVHSMNNTYFSTVPRDITLMIAQLVCNTLPIDIGAELQLETNSASLFYQENDKFAHHNCNICTGSLRNLYIISSKGSFMSICGQKFNKHKNVKNSAYEISQDGYQYRIKAMPDTNQIKMIFQNILTGEKSHQYIPGEYQNIINVTSDHIYYGVQGQFYKIGRDRSQDKCLPTRILSQQVSFVIHGGLEVTILNHVDLITVLINGHLLHGNCTTSGGVIYHANGMYFITTDGKVMHWSLDFVR